MIDELYFFGNGNVGAFDASRHQLPFEQEPAYVAVVREKLARGVVSAETKIFKQWELEPLIPVTVKDVIERFGKGPFA